MIPFKYIKTPPTTYLIKFVGGTRRRAGRGLSFWYLAPTTTLVAVPVGTTDQGFIFEEVSADFQQVSTGLGSTGWYKSLVAGALGLSAAVGAREIPTDLRTTNPHKQADPTRLPDSHRSIKPTPRHNDPSDQAEFPWEANFLRFTVREPFPSGTSGVDLVAGEVSPGQPLRIVSRMAGEGVIFSDGIERDFLEFNSGTEALVSVAQRKGRIVQ